MNTMYLGEFSFRVSGCESEQAFEDHLDVVLDHLYGDPRVVDPDYAASLALRMVEFSLSVQAADDDEAFGIIRGALRAAIHAAEGCTPGWENAFTQTKSTVSAPVFVDA